MTRASDITARGLCNQGLYYGAPSMPVTQWMSLEILSETEWVYWQRENRIEIELDWQKPFILTRSSSRIGACFSRYHKKDQFERPSQISSSIQFIAKTGYHQAVQEYIMLNRSKGSYCGGLRLKKYLQLT